MEHAIEVLEKAESVLMKRASKIKEGAPKWAVNNKILELRKALKLIKNNNS